MWSSNSVRGSIRTALVSEATATGTESSDLNRRLDLEYRYLPQGSLDPKQERGPKVIAWTTLPRAKGEPHAFHRHRLEPTDSGSGFSPVRVSFPYDPSQKWRQDTCVRFLLMSQIQSSSGQWTYAKTASTEVYLADLISSQNPRQQTVPMRVQSYYMPAPGQDSEAQVEAERHKGDLQVGLFSVGHRQHYQRSVKWAPAHRFDLTPANTPVLQAGAMLAVSRGMAPFEPQMVGKAMPPTLPEIHNVHAPLYVQETPVALDGSVFWTRACVVARDHVDYHGGRAEAEKYLGVLLSQSMQRHNMTQREFLDAAQAFQGPKASSRGSRKVSDAQLRKAVAVVATACTLRVNTMRYVADKAVLARSKQAVVVESFDQVDLRTADDQDSGGATSYDMSDVLEKRRAAPAAGLVSASASVPQRHRRQLPPVLLAGANAGLASNGRDQAVGGAMDCEDGARDAAVHFALMADPGAGLPNRSLHSPVVRGARSVASHYRAVGVLSSVLSRSLGDSQQQGQETQAPPIGSVADGRVEVGAHMFTLLIPKRVLHRNVARAMRHKRVPDPSGRADSVVGRIPSQTPLASGRELPVALCEGTGILHPFMLAGESYGHGTQERVDLAVEALLEQEGQLRLRTAHTSLEMAEAAAGQEMAMEDAMADARRRARRSGTSPSVVVIRPPESSLDSGAPPPAALDQFTPMHTQERLVGDPDARIVPSFYRTPSELYLVSTAAELEQRRNPDPGTNATAGTTTTLVGDRMIPIQIGNPRQGGGRISGGSGGSSWGLALSDILRQRTFVGFLPTPKPTADETRVVDRVHSHVAPAVALHLDHHMGSDRYLRQASRWSDMMANECRLKPVRQLATDPPHGRSVSASSSSLVTVHGYAHPRDLTDQSVLEMGHWLRDQNPHLVAASLSLERSTYRLAMVRIDAVVDCGKTARMVRPKLHQLISAASSRPSPSRAAYPAGNQRLAESSWSGDVSNISVSVQGGVYLLNGRPRAPLVMRNPGTRYRFVFDAAVARGNHPLYLTTSPVGDSDAQGSILTASKMQEIRGAVDRARQAGTGGEFTIKPAVDVVGRGGSRQRLYYQCAVHPNMGGPLVLA